VGLGHEHLIIKRQGRTPAFYYGAFILPNPNLFSKSVMCRTRGARGGSELNRTLHESPATASLHSATPKRKNVPYSFDFRGGGFFLKWKGLFSFWGSAFQVFRQCGGASIRTRFCENYFLGIWIFAKPRLMFLKFGGAGRKRGLGKMNSRSALAFGLLAIIKDFYSWTKSSKCPTLCS